MKLVLQRVSSASISVNGGEPKAISRGLVILAGINLQDDERIADFMAEKAANLRIFDDENGNMNLSLIDVKGECITASNFTLYANCRKGRRPSFANAAPAEYAKPLYAYFVKALEKSGIQKIIDGEFGADMQVGINNDGPVTIVLDSEDIMPRQNNMELI